MRILRNLSSIAPFCLALVGGCRPFEDLGRREREDPPPTAERCGSCHVAIYREWRDSPHARSFRSADFLARTDHGSIERCLTCHVPAELPASPERPPAFRDAHRTEGVTCISCHRLPPGHGEAGAPPGTMAGPLSSGALVQPHPIAEGGEWFRDARFCGRCHEDTLAQWNGSPLATKPVCQECHMPAVERKVTQPTGPLSGALVLFEEGLPLRAHRFSGAAAREEAVKVIGCEFLDLSAAVEGRTLVLELRSLLPHDLPTGGFGSRRISLRLHLEDETIVLGVLSNRKDRALLSGGRLRLEAPLPPPSPPLEVVHGVLEAVREAGPEPDGEPLFLWSRAFEVERPLETAGRAPPRAPGGR